MRWLTNNFWLKMLSLALAFVFSSYIYYEVDFPIPESVFLPLDVRNLSPGLILLEKLPSTVEVQVRGSYRSISHLNTQAHPAIVDFSGIVDAGPQTIEVEYPSLGDVVITGHSLDHVSVELDRVAKRNLPLVIWHTGELDPAFLMSNERTAVRNVQVEGPKQLVDEVSLARIEPDLAELSSGIESSGDSLTAALQVRLYGGDGNPIPNPTLTVAPEKVDYSVDLTPIGNFKVLRVVPEFSGMPAPGYLIVGMQCDPQFVPIEPQAGTEDVFAIRTEMIDIGGAKADFDRRVRLRYSTGTKREGGLEECTVHFLVRRMTEEDGQFAAAVQLEGARAGYEYILVPSSVRITPAGEVQLSDADKRSLQVSVDVAELEQGVFQLAPQVELPLRINTIRISPPSVRLTVLKRGEGAHG